MRVHVNLFACRVPNGHDLIDRGWQSQGWNGKKSIVASLYSLERIDGMKGGGRTARLTAAGAHCLVIVPRKFDEARTGVKRLMPARCSHPLPAAGVLSGGQQARVGRDSRRQRRGATAPRALAARGTGAGRTILQAQRPGLAAGYLHAGYLPDGLGKGKD